MTDRRSSRLHKGKSLLLSLLAGTTLGACSGNETASGGGTGGTSQTGGQNATSNTSNQSGGAATSSTATIGGTGVGGNSTSNVGGAGVATSASTGTASGGTSTSSTAGGAAVQGGTKASSTSIGGSSSGSSSRGGSSSGGATGVGGASGGQANPTTGGNANGGATNSYAGTSNQGGNSGTGGGQAGASSKTTCAARVLSLGANRTNGDPDTAYAHVEVDLQTDLPIGNAARTVEFWAFIKTTDWVGEKNQVFYYGGSDATGSFGLDFGTPNVSGSTSNHATLNPFTGSAIRDDSGKDLGINSSSDQWVHIAMTWNGTVLTTYVNGLPKITAQGSGSTTTLSTTQSILMIGCNPTNKNCFNGYFSEFRVWNVARSEAQIKDSYNRPLVGNESGLVGYWRFDDTTGSTTAADAVTTTGHTAHSGMLKADTAANNPTFDKQPPKPVPIVCQ